MNSRRLVIFYLLVSTLAGCPQQPKPDPGAEETASFVFLGTLSVKYGDQAAADLHAIRVDRTYFQAGNFDVPVGSEVFVTGTAVPSTGQHVFHVNPYQFGRHISARLVMVEPARNYGSDDVEKLRRQKRKETLQRRYKGVQLVVHGSINATREWRGRTGVESEHDPMFMWATVAVDETLVGQLAGSNVQFLYATSDDIHWYRSPKPSMNANAIFLLRRGFEGAGAEASDAWTLLHEDDFLQGQDMQIMREIINEGSGR